MFGQYPLLDFVGMPVLAAALALLLWSEKVRPLRRRVQGWFQRLLTNALLAAPAFLVLRLALIPAVVGVAVLAEQADFGIARWLPLPPLAAALVALLVLDYSMYLWHWLNHRVPLLWRFHHVHHTDLDLDVSTAFRFHFGEIVLSVIVRSAQVAIAGASPAVALLYEILLELSTQFHHSNLRLPLHVERVLSWFIMTPRAHGIHHSIEARETNSNFSNLLILWDRLHRTLRLDVPQDRIVIGVPDYRDPHELTVAQLLLMPFRKPRAPPPRWPSDASTSSRERKRLAD